jgi:hypothetical protein
VNPGNHLSSRALPSGAEGIRTDGHCGRDLELFLFSPVNARRLFAARAFSITIDALAFGSSLFCLRPPPRRGRIAIRWIEVDAATTEPTLEDGGGSVVVAPGWVRIDIGGPKGAEGSDQSERKPVPQSQGPGLSHLAQEFPADRSGKRS